MEFDKIAYFQTENNIAHRLTKLMKNSVLIRILGTSKLDHPIGQWIRCGNNIDNIDSKKSVMST